MTCMQTVGAADPDFTSFLFRTDATPSEPASDHFGRLSYARPAFSPHRTASSLEGLLARIEGGIASQEDVAYLPQSVLRYVEAVAALCDAGILDQEGSLTVSGDMLLRLVDG